MLIHDAKIEQKFSFLSQWILVLGYIADGDLNPLIGTLNNMHDMVRCSAVLKPQSNGPSYSNTAIGTLAVDGLAVTFGTAKMGLGGAAARPGPSSLY